jgi:MraZ protein
VGNGGEQFMFIGEFEYRVDEKGRVPIPPKFRTEELKKDGVILSPGMEKCITIYPPSEWKKLADSLTSGPIIPSKLRKLNRAIFATAFNIEIDGQGRIVVPIQLRQYAGINDEVVMAGANTYLELWGKEQWNSEKSISQEEAWHIIETLEQR